MSTVDDLPFSLAGGETQGLTLHPAQQEDTLPDILLSGVLERIASFLPPNDAACGLRLANKTTSIALSCFNVIKLSQPAATADFTVRWSVPGAMRPLNLAKRKQFLCLTAASGSLDNLRVAIAAAGLLPFPELSEAAAAAGHLHVLQWLRQEGWPLGQVLKAAAGNGHRAVCEWCLTDPLQRTNLRPAAEAAARGGHVPLMNWLRQRVTPPIEVDAPLLLAAAFGCDLATLQRLQAMWAGKRLDRTAVEQSILQEAGGSPRPDWQAKIAWLESIGYQNRHTACCGAAGRADAAARLAWLRERGYPMHGQAAVRVARAGNTDALTYLLQQAGLRLEGLQLAFAVRAAVHGGHLAALQLLHSTSGPVWQLDRRLLKGAASLGRLAILECAAETVGFHIIEPGPDLFGTAARSGSVELLAWLRERGCEWDDRAPLNAARAGCEEALEWLAERGCPWPDDGEPYVQAVSNGDLAILRALRRLGCPWALPASFFAESLETACDLGCSEDHIRTMLRTLLEEGCPVDWDATLAAAADDVRCSPALVAWIQEERLRREAPPPPPPL